MSALLLHLQISCTSTRLTSLAESAASLQEFIQTTLSLSLDEYEFAILKALSIFSPGKFNCKLIPYEDISTLFFIFSL